jgi:hybrid cluster-associated redox disulfide protein
MDKIIKDMTIQEIFYKYPDKRNELAKVLMQAGLGCLGCAAAQFETLEQGLLAHGKSDKEINLIINSLNSIISK